MNQPVIDIERVVREVLAELRGDCPNVRRNEHGTVTVGASDGRAAAEAPLARGPALTPGPRQSKNARVGAYPERTAADGDLVLDRRVVTTDDIAGRLDSVRRVVVRRNAVVTPAVRDELLRRGIALGCVDWCGGRQVVSARLVLMTSGAAFDAAGLAAGLEREGLKVERAASDCVIAAVDQLANEIARPDTLGALLTPHTAAALCLANRRPGIRAVMGRDAPSVAVAAAAVGANLLAVDPEMGTFFQLKQVVTEFCRCGVRPCPGVFHSRLT